jgi:hypothetical protein
MERRNDNPLYGDPPMKRRAIVQRQANLLAVIQALRAIGSFSDLLHSRQQQRNQHSDDGGHHQELDQGKARLSRGTDHMNIPPKKEKGNKALHFSKKALSSTKLLTRKSRFQVSTREMGEEIRSR